MKTKSLLSGVVVLFFLTTGFLTSAMAKPGWGTDYHAALAQAKKENRPVLIDFTGSDWCPWCVKQDKDVFSQAAFQNFAKSNLVLFEADFPNSKPQSATVKKQNEGLQQQFGVNGFPTLLLVNSDGKEIARHEGYMEGGPEAFIAWFNSAMKK